MLNLVFWELKQLPCARLVVKYTMSGSNLVHQGWRTNFQQRELYENRQDQWSRSIVYEAYQKGYTPTFIMDWSFEYIYFRFHKLLTIALYAMFYLCNSHIFCSNSKNWTLWWSMTMVMEKRDRGSEMWKEKRENKRSVCRSARLKFWLCEWNDLEFEFLFI